MVDDYIIIDLETTSFEVKSGIKEVGMMIIENGNIADKFHYGIVAGYARKSTFRIGVDNSTHIKIGRDNCGLLTQYPFIDD